MCNTTLQRCPVEASHNRGVMVMVPKKTSPEVITDLRTVTFLNANGDVFSRVLTRSLENLHHKVLDGPPPGSVRRSAQHARRRRPGGPP